METDTPDLRELFVHVHGMANALSETRGDRAPSLKAIDVLHKAMDQLLAASSTRS
jgi:hypothetical protein